MASWYEKAVFYHIYPLGMLGAPFANTEDAAADRFPELDQWVPHMEALGCTALYIGPLFESSSHGYDTRDYRLVDRRLGTNEGFRHFTELCHKAGIKVVVDGVFNHTGREFFAFQDIQKNREQSRYCGWYKGVNFGWNSPYNDGFGYEAWQGHFELPCLNLQNPEVKQYLFDVIRFWISEFDIDGIRLDCANVMDFGFMQEMRSQTASMEPDFWLMGEVIHGEYGRWVNDGMLHSVTNYELHKSLYSGLNDHNFFEIAHNVRRLEAIGTKLYTFLDNHDENRIASKLNKKAHLPLAWTLLFTLPGIPSIYYGSEMGIEGMKKNGSDAALRPCIELDKQIQNTKLTKHIEKLGLFKQSLPVLSFGDYQQVYLTNEQFVFSRTYLQQHFYAAFNTSEYDVEIHFTCKEKTLLNLWDDTIYNPENDTLTLFIPSKSSLLLINDKHSDVQKTTNQNNTKPSQITSIPIGLYEHFKGKQYRVLHIAKHSETEEAYVVYQQMYGNKEIWIRPLSMFIETIDKNGEKIPRFKYIGE